MRGRVLGEDTARGPPSSARCVVHVRFPRALPTPLPKLGCALRALKVPKSETRLESQAAGRGTIYNCSVPKCAVCRARLTRIFQSAEPHPATRGPRDQSKH